MDGPDQIRWDRDGTDLERMGWDRLGETRSGTAGQAGLGYDREWNSPVRRDRTRTGEVRRGRRGLDGLGPVRFGAAGTGAALDWRGKARPAR
jgi:hypothetical protein